MYLSFNRSINQSDNSEISSPEHNFNLNGIAKDEITNILQETMSEDQLTSAASHESEQVIEAELERRIEAEPEKKHVQNKTVECENTEHTVSRATSTTRSSGSGECRSSRVSKPFNKINPSPSPRTPKRKSRTSLPSAERNTGNKILRKMLSIAQTV